MTVSTLGELIQNLLTVEERLERAQAELATSRTALDQTETALARIDPEHPETVVPPGLHRANDQLERTQAAVDRVSELIREFRTSL